MAYTTYADLKTYLGIPSTETGDDTLLTTIIARAQSMIDAHTHRTFEAASDTTRHFTVGKDTSGRTLHFDRDICSITTVKTNADDGSGGTTIPAASYITLPRDETPYYAIRILTSADYVWEYTSDPEAGITIAGKWAYSTTPPADIVMATTRWAAYIYRAKDAPIFDVVGMPGAGMAGLKAGIPADIAEILAPYVRQF